MQLCDIIDTRTITFLSKMEQSDNLYISILYNTFAVHDLRLLFVKHRINSDSRLPYKTVIRENFALTIN